MKKTSRGFGGLAYLAALEKHYGGLYRSGMNLFGVVDEWRKGLETLDRYADEERFVPLTQRAFKMERNVWSLSSSKDLRWVGARLSYKGLVHLKPPFDLALYSSLIWELRPRTIIEFGALQGGSALWFGDQLKSIARTAASTGKVHSFELLTECIHPRARSSNVRFHRVDLNDLSTLSPSLFRSLPHPWLVIDDAHTNIEALASWLIQFMKKGDYYVWEDVFMRPRKRDPLARALCDIATRHGFLVDTKYTDAFGMKRGRARRMRG